MSDDHFEGSFDDFLDEADGSELPEEDRLDAELVLGENEATIVVVPAYFDEDLTTVICQVEAHDDESVFVRPIYVRITPSMSKRMMTDEGQRPIRAKKTEDRKLVLDDGTVLFEGDS